MVHFRGFIYLVELRVSWVILGGVRWFGGTLTDRGGAVFRQVMGGGLGGF